MKKSKNLPKYVRFEPKLVGLSGAAIRGVIKDATALKAPILVATERDIAVFRNAAEAESIDLSSVSIVCEDDLVCLRDLP